MARILAIDDDADMCKLIELALRRHSHEVRTAASGVEGLKEMRRFKPDVVIIDKLMPGMDGYEVVRRIRHDPHFNRVPVLVLTAEADLEGKVTAFEIGADDYLNKPFATEELVARIAALVRRSQMVEGGSVEPHLIAVHSLRGGIGSTTLAVNLAVALRDLWGAPTLLLDMALVSGHVSLFLNKRAKQTWASLRGYAVEAIEDSVVSGLLQEYGNGLQFIAAPELPGDAGLIRREMVEKVLELLRPSYDYIVVDLPHDFSAITLALLDEASVVLSLVAPELASLRAASLALDTYNRIGYTLENVKLVLNRPFEARGLDPMDIERALKHPVAAELPFAGAHCVQAINKGEPLLTFRPQHAFSRALEDFAFEVSKSSHREFPPILPSAAWQRVQESQQSNSKVRRTVGRIFR